MDYRRFLARTEQAELPYLGGGSVETPDRRLRVTEQVAEGWWRFRITGRRAAPAEVVDAPDLSGRPAVVGHLAGPWLFANGRDPERLHLLPADEPLPLSAVRARRWHGGALLFDVLELEEDAEEEARRALEEGRPLGALRGAAASLRAAFGYARVASASARLGTPISPHEVHRRLAALADGGPEVAEELLAAIAARRLEEQARRQADALRARVAEVAAGEAAERARGPGRWRGRRPEPRPRRRDGRSFEEAAWLALDAAGASLLGARELAEGIGEVRFSFMGERFVSVVDAVTLRVHDAGICLSGADRQLNLDSLPAVIREAIATGALNITRWS